MEKDEIVVREEMLCMYLEGECVARLPAVQIITGRSCWKKKGKTDKG